MLVIAFIGTFIVGFIAGITSLVLFSKHYTNMTLDEMSSVGWMMYEAGNNRESAMVLHRNDGTTNEVVFEEF